MENNKKGDRKNVAKTSNILKNLKSETIMLQLIVEIKEKDLKLMEIIGWY